MDSAAPADPDLARLRATRLGLQAVAEHVLAPALHRATGHIGLRRAPGGITTPPFPAPDGGVRTIAIDGTDLVVRDRGGERRAPLTTLRAAGEVAGMAPGEPVAYPAATPLDPDRALDLDPVAAARLAGWYALVDEGLRQVQSETGEAGTIQLWPEHFDLAVPVGEINLGGSPGDEDHPLPYLYVGPWSPPPPDGGFWNEPFGASRSQTEIVTADDAFAFFAEGRRRLAG